MERTSVIMKRLSYHLFPSWSAILAAVLSRLKRPIQASESLMPVN